MYAKLIFYTNHLIPCLAHRVLCFVFFLFFSCVVLQKQPMERGRVLRRPHFLSNANTALQFLSSKRIKLVNINPADLVDGRPPVVLGLIWTIILYFQVSVVRQTRPAKASIRTHICDALHQNHLCDAPTNINMNIFALLLPVLFHLFMSAPVSMGVELLLFCFCIVYLLSAFFCCCSLFF